MVERTERRPRGGAGRVPPHNVEAESSLLGALLLSPDAEIDTAALARYAPYHAAHAELLMRAGRRREAADAYDRAIDVTDDDALRRHLMRRRTAALR